MLLSVDFLESSSDASELRNHISFEPVQSQQFDTTYVVLDNRQFTDCRFQACILVYSGGPFAMIKCEIDDDTFVELTGAAARGHLVWNKFQTRRAGSAPDRIDVKAAED